MVRFDCTTRYVWGLGLLNGFLAVAAVGALFGGGVWVVPLRLALPYGLLVSWRAAVYVRALLHDRADRLHPLLEGFALMALSTVVPMAPELWTASHSDAGVSLFGLLFYAALPVMVGGFGAAVAAALATLDLLLVEIASPYRGAGRPPWRSSR